MIAGRLVVFSSIKIICLMVSTQEGYQLCSPLELCLLDFVVASAATSSPASSAILPSPLLISELSFLSAWPGFLRVSSSSQFYRPSRERLLLFVCFLFLCSFVEFFPKAKPNTSVLGENPGTTCRCSSYLCKGHLR